MHLTISSIIRPHLLLPKSTSAKNRQSSHSCKGRIELAAVPLEPARSTPQRFSQRWSWQRLLQKHEEVGCRFRCEHTAMALSRAKIFERFDLSRRMNRLGVFPILFFAVTSVAAFGQTPQQTLYSKTFYGSSATSLVNHDQTTGCSLIDRCDTSLNGTDAIPVLVNPWEPFPIDIRCVQIVFLPNGKVGPGTALFAGNSYSPDIMLWSLPRDGGGFDSKNLLPLRDSVSLSC